jgi:hypothetical protein
MGGKGMNDNLKQFLNQKYQVGKSDLFSAFIVRCNSLTTNHGLTGLITLHGWMFISTFSDLRKWLLKSCSFDSLVHVGGNSFPSMNSQIARAVSFVFQSKLKDIVSRTVCYDLDSIKNSHSVDKEQLFNTKLSKKETIIKDFNDFKNVESYTFLYSVPDSLLDIFIKNKTIGEIAKPRQGLASGDNNRFVRFWFEIPYGKHHNSKNLQSKWFTYNKGGDFRKWYGNNQFVVNWENDGAEIKNDKLQRLEKGLILASNSKPKNTQYYLKPGITYSLIGNSSFCARKYYDGHLFDVGGSGLFVDSELEMLLLGLVNSVVGSYLLSRLNPTINFQVGDIANIPVVVPSKEVKLKIETITLESIEIAKDECSYWEENNEFLTYFKIKHSPNLTLSQYVQDIINDNVSCINKLYENEKLLNSIFCKLYTIQDNSELTDHLTINLYGLWKSNNTGILIDDNILLHDAIKNLLSYAVGCFFGRYTIDKSGLILVNQGETTGDFERIIPKPSFKIDEDNIIPILEDEYFNDDIVGKLHEFIRIAFGIENFESNLNYIEKTVEKDVRNYFLKDFYNDHLKRYKKRPIYWMFSSPKGHFKALIYMHRYRPDTISSMLNDYLRVYIGKLESEQQSLNQTSISESASAREQTLATKRIAEIEVMLKDLKIYERTLFDYAAKKIEIDLDDGVKVNYLKFKEILVPIKGLEKDEE